MKHKISLLILIAAVLLISAGVVLSTSVSGFHLPWWTVGGGGGVSEGGDYLVQGTIGQYDAGSLLGEGYRLDGGFWHSLEARTSENEVFLPIIMR